MNFNKICVLKSHCGYKIETFLLLLSQRTKYTANTDGIKQHSVKTNRVFNTKLSSNILNRNT